MLLFSLSLICALFGLVVIWSATQHLDNPARYVIVQSLGIFIGVAAYAVITVIDLDIFAQHWEMALRGQRPRSLSCSYSSARAARARATAAGSASSA